MKLYKPFSLVSAIIFAIVGLIFLFIPNSVLVFFNHLSAWVQLPPTPVEAVHFYLILAVGYMYLVTVLALLMYRHPRNSFFPLLLAQGKLASSLLSLLFFLLHQSYLIYLTNAVVDGGIGIAALIFYLKLTTADK